MSDALVTAIETGATVVTADWLQADQLRLWYGTHCRDGGQKVWQTPDIITWNAWVKRLAGDIMWSGYSSGRVQRTLLSPTQEQRVWEGIIGGSRDEHQLLNIASAAGSAREAWAWTHQWRLPDPAKLPFASREVQTYSRWMRAYHAICSESAWLDEARLPDTVSPALRAGAIEAPGHILLFGFDRFNTQQRVLLKMLENLGARLDLLPVSRQPSRTVRCRFATFTDELAAAARWASLAVTEDGHKALAVMVPDISAHRTVIERIFDETLLPGSSQPGSGNMGRPYRLAAAADFSAHPLVRGALQILQLVEGHTDIVQLGRLLRSPYTLGGFSENPVRARFDAWLREGGLTDVAVRSVPNWFRRFRDTASIPDDRVVTEAIFHGIVQHLDSARGAQAPSTWAQLFRTFLDIFGWPGDGNLGNVETQIVERLRDVLNEFARLDVVQAPVRARDAMGLLRRVCSEVQFHPAGPRVPIQILDPRHAQGGTFDAVWICGWHSENWPPAPDPNPFLPIEWQRERGMPRSSAALSLQYARDTTANLLGCAPEVIVSWPDSEGDRALFCAPLVAALEEVAEADIPMAADIDARGAARRDVELEVIEDRVGPRREPSESVPGGTRILKLQAACPFRAFAELRLGAEPLKVPQPGLDALERGKLMHTGLEYVWARIKSLALLNEMLGGEFLQVQVWEVVDKALDLLEKKRWAGLSKRFRALEHARQVRLIVDWLRLEAQRAPFEVLHTEVRRNVRIGELDFPARIDRIDRLDDQSVAIIDYKTGDCKVNDWMGPRPNEPQLPAYAINEEDDLAAVLFARIKVNEFAFVGAAREDGIAPDVTAFDTSRAAGEHALKWDELRDAWRTVLETLAGKFVAGDARVDPKQGATTCRDCHLATLCRIGEVV